MKPKIILIAIFSILIACKTTNNIQTRKFVNDYADYDYKNQIRPRINKDEFYSLSGFDFLWLMIEPLNTGQSMDDENWISAAAYKEAIIFCRWLLAEEMPEQPTVELCEF